MAPAFHICGTKALTAHFFVLPSLSPLLFHSPIRHCQHCALYQLLFHTSEPLKSLNPFLPKSKTQDQTAIPPAEETMVSGNEAQGFELGQRVHASGDPQRTGTVRYIGSLEGYPGTWIGVDWDDGNGKHDGTVNGVRYFEASGERSGSFVRAKNLSAGITFLEGLHLRYRGDYTKEEEDEMYVLSTRKNRVSVQLLGKDKAQEKFNHLQELDSASISCTGVSSTGPLHEIGAELPNLKELDMTGNLLSKWQDVEAICEALPALEILNLTKNRVEQSIHEPHLLERIRILVLNSCGLTWNEVEILRESLPAVEELHLVANNIKTMMTAPSSPMENFIEGFGSLKLLNLDENHIDSWDEILKLSQLRSLEQLHLNKNKLKHIFYPACSKSNIPKDDEYQDKYMRPFENLCHLLLGCNEIEDVASIDSLNSFPSLTVIRLSENPIVDPAKGGIPRFVLVACLAKVEILNGSEVRQRERRESEIRYVRLVLAKMQSNDPEEIKQFHPRFTELKLLHGLDDEKPSVGSTGPQKMASGLLSITLKCVGASIGEKPPLTKKLPPSTTVGRLKVLCESFFKLNGVKPRLFLPEEGSLQPLLLEDEMVPLVDLGIGSGSTILVDAED